MGMKLKAIPMIPPDLYQIQQWTLLKITIYMIVTIQWLQNIPINVAS